MYKVSVLVPIYGVEGYIERCARSLFEQTYSNLEYVFVNDCTPDKSVEILEQLVEDYPHRKPFVKIISHEKNKGLSVTRNTAIDNASGEFICAVDSDDWLAKDAIEKLVKKQIENDADIVSGSWLIHFEGEDLLLKPIEIECKEQMTLQMMQRTWNHFFAGRLIRRSVFVNNGLHWVEGLDIGEDRYIMTLASYYSDRFARLEDVVYHYDRRKEHTLTVGFDKNCFIKRFNQELGVVIAIENFFKDKNAVFLKESKRCCIEQLALTLKTATEYGLKNIFYQVLEEMNSRSESEWRMIGLRKDGIRGWCIKSYGIQRLIWIKDRGIRWIKKRLKRK